MNIPYFSFYPQEWLADPKVAQLNYEEKGVYFDLLCRMWTYADGSCSLPSDDQFLCRMLRMRPAKWEKIKGILIEGIAPVFTVQEGRLLNKRLSKEFAIAKEKSKKNFASAKKRWGDKSSNPLKTKETDHANALPTDCHKDKDKDKENKDTSYLSKRKNATQIPDDFQPDEKHRILAAELHLNIEQELHKFIDWWKSRGTPMKDWDACFRNWLRKAAEIKQRDNHGNYNQRPDGLTPNSGDAFFEDCRKFAIEGRKRAELGIDDQEYDITKF